MMNTDNEWEKWGKFDPYYGVLSDDKFRVKNITDDVRKEFFETGVKDIEHIIAVIKRHFKADFSPQNALDFGCGTGRLVIPLSTIAKKVVGIDVSNSMLKIARSNSDERGIKNISYLSSDDTLSGLSGSFDLIHSYLVFQHIPTSRGKKIIRALLEHLEENGMGAIHFTYGSSRYFNNFGKPDFKILRKLFRMPKRVLKKLLFGQKDPYMEMNKYSIDEILYILQQTGIRNVFMEFTDHDGQLGVYLFFQKSSSISTLK